MFQLTAVDAQKPCQFYHIKLFHYASSRFAISMVDWLRLSPKYAHSFCAHKAPIIGKYKLLYF